MTGIDRFAARYFSGALESLVSAVSLDVRGTASPRQEVPGVGDVESRPEAGRLDTEDCDE
jgi:hypothetical protein